MNRILIFPCSDFSEKFRKRTDFFLFVSKNFENVLTFSCSLVKKTENTLKKPEKGHHFFQKSEPKSGKCG